MLSAGSLGKPTAAVVFTCWLLVLLLFGKSPVWGDCEVCLEFYSAGKYDRAIEVAYTQLADTSLSPDNMLCAYKILGISYYAKGETYEDSVEFFMRELAYFSPQYRFDPNDNWPPDCRDLVYKYQRKWRKDNPALSASDVTTLAILPFENNSIVDHEELDPLREGLADMLITDLSKVINLRIVERERLQSVLEEMGKGETILIDEKTAVKVGKILGAQSILFGSFLKLNQRKMRIDARIIKTETAQLIKADKLEGTPKKLFEMISDLALKVAQHLNVAVSAVERKAIEHSNGRSWEAALLYAQGLRFEDQGDYRNAYKMYQEALKTDSDFVEAERRFYNLQSLVK